MFSDIYDAIEELGFKLISCPMLMVKTADKIIFENNLACLPFEKFKLHLDYD